jgi:hypothetical protein
MLIANGNDPQMIRHRGHPWRPTLKPLLAFFDSGESGERWKSGRGLPHSKSFAISKAFD